MKLFGEEMSARKQFWRGTHRTRAPQETLDACVPLMSMIGITRLANVTGLDRIGLPVCVAIRPNSRALATTQGKGETIAAAKTSALMEAIESWHGERVGAPVHLAAYREVRSQAADPQQLAIRADATFRDDRALPWLEGENLCNGRATLTPYETVSTNFVEHPDQPPTFLKTTNGLASGNHLLEATVHALLEVIERDALALWSLRGPESRRSRQVDLVTIDDPHVQEVLSVLREKGVAASIADITTDTCVPAFTCTLIDDPHSAHWRGIPQMAGHGAHLEPQVAVSRALHEAIQSRVTMISGSRDDMFPRDYLNAGGREAQARALEGFAQTPLRFDPTASAAGESFEDDLAILLTRLRHCGIDNVIAVNLSREEVGIPVVKVVVPGLEPVRTAVYVPGQRAQRLLQRRAVA